MHPLRGLGPDRLALAAAGWAGSRLRLQVAGDRGNVLADLPAARRSPGAATLAWPRCRALLGKGIHGFPIRRAAARQSSGRIIVPDKGRTIQLHIRHNRLGRTPQALRRRTEQHPRKPTRGAHGRLESLQQRVQSRPDLVQLPTQLSILRLQPRLAAIRSRKRLL